MANYLGLNTRLTEPSLIHPKVIRIFSLILLLGVGFELAVAEERVAADVVFAWKIQPLFKTKCLTCHGDDPKKLKGDLDMRSLMGLLKGGESEEPSIVVGEPLKSPLYLAVTRMHEDDWLAMPPKENDKLTVEQVGYIKKWIKAGAPWPNEERIAIILKETNPWGEGEGVFVKTSGGLDGGWTNRQYDPEKLWAYKPIKKPEVPVKGHPIDAFIKARLPEGLTFAPRAQPVNLIRRVTYSNWPSAVAS